MSAHTTTLPNVDPHASAPPGVDTHALDAKIARLQAHKDDWARLPLEEKIHHLGEMRRRTGKVAEEWVEAAAKAKGIPLDSPLVGEEWAAGPWALLHGINRYVETLVALAKGEDLLKHAGPIRTRPDGQVVVQVYPLNIYERLLMHGVRAEVWMQRDVTLDNLREHMASFYRQPNPQGQVTLVLGAGNVASITPLDVLHQLIAKGSVTLVKMNPVNDYLGPFFEEIFATLQAYGFVEFAYGGADVGQYLVYHPGIEAVHMTGSARTFDAIVWGPGEEGRRRKERGEPLLKKPITAELGNVTPTIVVPGPWEEEDLRFQAEHIATQKMQNCGFNCIAAQVLITARDWELNDRLLFHLRTVLREVPYREPYYPGADQRQALAAQAGGRVELLDEPGTCPVPRTLITEVDPESDAPFFREEVFGPVLVQTGLPTADPGQFLRQAVQFANERLYGTLGANIIIHPKTARRYRRELDQALADLRYGSIGVNIWVGAGFLLSQTTWGAYPGHTLQDIGSGIGVVHNTFLFDKPEKSVVYGNFYPFPRNLRHGQFQLLPKPPWFVTHRFNHGVGWRMAAFAENPGWIHLPGIFIDALRG